MWKLEIFKKCKVLQIKSNISNLISDIQLVQVTVSGCIMCVGFVIEAGHHGQYPPAKLSPNWAWGKDLFYSLHPVLIRCNHHWCLLCFIIVVFFFRRVLITSLGRFIMNGRTLISESFLKLNKITFILNNLQFVLKIDSSSCLGLMLLHTLSQKTVKLWSVHCSQTYLISVFFFLVFKVFATY